MSGITFALPKGRLAGELLGLLARAGVERPEISNQSRKLIFEAGRYRFFLAKPADVPAYVEHGAADIGAAGYDTIAEEGRELCQLLDLGLGKCKMAVAGSAGAAEKLLKNEHIRVATKYPNAAAAHFRKTSRRSFEIIKLNGSVELGPLTGLSDVIVDIVQSGDTLKQNGLLVLEDVFPASARLIANPAALTIKNAEIAELVRKLRLAL
jgi:ATP phosphoribosyltransferase